MIVGKKIANPPGFQPAKIKLSEVTHSLRNVEFKPEEFVAVRMKLKNPDMMVTLFSNGKLMTQGGRSRFSCTVAMRKVARMLQALPEYKDEIEDISTPSFHSVQANAHVGHRIDVEGMAAADSRRCEYVPDMSGSAYLTFRDPNVYGDKGSCHVHHVGTITILGCKSVEKCKQWIEDMWAFCEPHFIDEEKMKMDNMCQRQDATLEFKDNDTAQGDAGATEQIADDDMGLMAPPMIDGLAPPPLLDI